MYNLPDLTPIFYLAMVGVVAIGLTIVAGIGFAIWFAINHVQIV